MVTNDMVKDNKLLKAVVDGFPAGVVIIDRDFTVKWLNTAAKVMHKVSNLSDVIGGKCYREFLSKDEPCQGCPAQWSFLEGLAGSMLCLKDKGNSPKGQLLELFTSPILGKDGRVEFVSLYSMDVSHRLHSGGEGRTRRVKGKARGKVRGKAHVEVYGEQWWSGLGP